MKQTRNIHELLKLAYVNFDKYFASGLCGMTQRMLHFGLINEDEYIELEIYFDKNLPKFKYNIFYVWEPLIKEPRKQWLLEQMDKTR